jgi:hypothetical protein
MILSRPDARRSLRPIVVLAMLTLYFRAPVYAQRGVDGWVDFRTAGQIRCRADFALDDDQGLFGPLEQLQTDLTRMLGVEPAREPVELNLFADKSAYRKYLQARLPQVPNRRALFLKGAGPGQVIAYRSAELAVDLRHETTHALLHASLPMVPLWLDEGLAEYFEVVPALRPFRKDYLNTLKWSGRLGATPRLFQLEAIRQLDDMDEANYRGAWAWVHFMLHGPPEAREELVAFLADIHARTPPGLLSRRLERRLPGLDRRVADHFKSWVIPRQLSDSQ